MNRAIENKEIMSFFSKLFSFTQELAIDLGTANTIIINGDQIIVDQPSVVALDEHSDRMIAVGEQAKLMYEKTNNKIRVIRPLRDGVIADFNACEQMMRGIAHGDRRPVRFYGSGASCCTRLRRARRWT